MQYFFSCLSERVKHGRREGPPANVADAGKGRLKLQQRQPTGRTLPISRTGRAKDRRGRQEGSGARNGPAKPHQRWRERRGTRFDTAREVLHRKRRVFPRNTEILQSWFADFQTFSYFCRRFYNTTDAYSHSRKHR